MAVGAINVIDRIDNAIYGLLDVTAKWLSGLPVTPVTEFLQASLLLVRRTFFDQAPTLHPQQLTGQVDGPITGTLGAVDPEQEAVTYSLLEAPTEGVVTLNADGTYTYIPGPEFDGSDAFVVSASDKSKSAGLQGNVLEPRRQSDTTAVVTPRRTDAKVITFQFTYAAGAQAVWDLHPDAITALKWAAFQLQDAVNPRYSVTLNFEVGLVSNGLAEAGSGRINTDAPGFYRTEVQTKIINGSSPDPEPFDGNIKFNFDPTYEDEKTGRDLPAKWNYFNAVAYNEYNFKNVAMHELLHTFGFNDNVKKPGCNYVQCTKGGAGVPTPTPKTNWFDYDRFTGNSTNQRAIDPSSYRWDPVFDKNLTAGKNSSDGLYFTGINAREAFEGPVPLLSEADYSNSSVSHLNDYYFNNKDLTAKNGLKLMNAYDKPGVVVPLTLSKAEIGILKDLGYRM